MSQPPDFESFATPNYICRLDKDLYGLKHHAWFSRFRSKLLTMGFVPSKGNTSLFLYEKSGITVFMLIYFDNIIVTSSSDQAISALLHNLSSEFALKDLGNLNFFS
jgi:hypothetical protein